MSIIDERGIITHIFSQVNTSTHAQDVLACVQ
jgi:peroxiredoxin